MKKKMAGGLVDFKENLIFEEYKDQPLRGAKSFRRRVKERYGITQTSDLYAKLINYQVAKYGEPIVVGSRISFIPHFENKKSTLTRKHNNQRQKEYYDYAKFLRRNNEGKGTEQTSKREDT